MTPNDRTEPGVCPEYDGENIWLLVYEDQDMEPVLFSNHGADEAARKAFEHAATKWTVRLFKCVAQDGYGPGTSQQPARQYYYRVDACHAPTSSDAACICWHDEGTGPLASDSDLVKEWRNKPAQPGSGEVKRYPSTHADIYMQDTVLASDFDRLQSALTAANAEAAFNKRGWDGAFLQAMENGGKANDLRDQLTAAQAEIEHWKQQAAVFAKAADNEKKALAAAQAEFDRLRNDRDAKTKRMWELGHECDRLQSALSRQPGVCPKCGSAVSDMEYHEVIVPTGQCHDCPGQQPAQPESGEVLDIDDGLPVCRCADNRHHHHIGCPVLERFDHLRSALAAERGKLAAWMIQHNFVTGHGDTTDDLLAELGAQVDERAQQLTAAQAYSDDLETRYHTAHERLTAAQQHIAELKADAARWRLARQYDLFWDGRYDFGIGDPLERDAFADREIQLKEIEEAKNEKNRTDTV